MTDTGDDQIAAFYDEHPYPPPIENIDETSGDETASSRRRFDHALLWPSLPYRDDQSILIAGCGTSQAARYALRHPNAVVTGIDVSSTSLDATRELADRHGLTNLELRAVPIEEVASLGRSFDHIVCTGVIHHLADPAAGLSALRNSLTPDGAMQLMVYGTYGRTGVYMMQEYCRRLGVTTAPGDLAELVETLRELPTGHPLGHVLRSTPDFRDDDAIADALLNPRDRSYTVPQVFDLLSSAGLRFARWVRQAPYRPMCGALSEVPHGQRVLQMTEPEQFAALELFRGTIRRHSLVAHRADSPLPVDPVVWDGDAWRSFVPIRPATVVVVEDKLPPGVAAVLINQPHTERDLVFFADAHGKEVYEQIDGRRPLGEIDGASAEFFERLWWHDLVMIDGSGRRPHLRR